MRLLEKLLIVLYLISLFFKFNRWIAGDYLLIFSSLFLGLFYWTSGWYLFKPKGEKSDAGLSVFFGGGIFFGFVGIFFKLLFWTGAHLFMYFSLLLMLPAILICVINISRKSELKKFYIGSLKRLIFPFVITIPLLLFFNREILVSIYNRDNPVYVKLWKEMYHNPGDTVLKKRFENYVRDYNASHYGRRK